MQPGFNRRNTADLNGFTIEWMATKQTDTLDRLAAEAIRQGADTIEIEHKDGYEEVDFMKGGTGSGFTLPSSSPEVRSLLKELHGIKKRGHRVTVDGCDYDLRVGTSESFGEVAFRVSLGRVLPYRSQH